MEDILRSGAETSTAHESTAIAADLEAAFERLRAEYPEVVEAMQVMQLSLGDYLEALTALQEPSLTSDNNVAA